MRSASHGAPHSRKPNQYPQFRRFCGTYSGTRMKTMGGCGWRKPVDTCFINCSPRYLTEVNGPSFRKMHSLTGCLAAACLPEGARLHRFLRAPLPCAMASRTSAALLCACIALLLLVNVSSAVEESQVAGATGTYLSSFLQ